MTSGACEVCFNLLPSMDSSQIIIPRCFSKYLDLSIPMDFLYNLSQFKIDGKSTTTIFGYAVEFFFLSGVYSEEILGLLFTLTLDGHAKQGCYSLPTSSITSFDHLVNELYRVFDQYEYQDFIDENDQLRMELTESIDHLVD